MATEPSAAAGDDLDLDLALFADPPDFYPPTPPPTTQTYTLSHPPHTGRTLTLHLVGHSVLEAHRLWNGSKSVSGWFEDRPHLVAGRDVLELGAGAGLPSLVAGTLGARRVVMTDYPDWDLVENMQRNVDLADEALEMGGRLKGRVRVRGYAWGRDTGPLLDLLGDDDDDDDMRASGAVASTTEPSQPQPQLQPPSPPIRTIPHKFDIIIMADLLFRHCEHTNLLRTVRETLRRARNRACYVFFTSYRPWLRHKDLAFFDLARMPEHGGFVVRQLHSVMLERPMFENDPGDVEVQKTVTGWSLTWPRGEWDEELEGEGEEEVEEEGEIERE